MSSTLERNAFPSELEGKRKEPQQSRWRCPGATQEARQSGRGLLDQVDVKLAGRAAGLPLFELARPPFGQGRVVVQRPAIPDDGAPLLGRTCGNVRAWLRGGARHRLRRLRRANAKPNSSFPPTGVLSAPARDG